MQKEHTTPVDLFKLQKDLPTLYKVDDAYNYKYVKLPRIMDQWGPVFHEHKVAVTWKTDVDKISLCVNGECVSSLGLNRDMSPQDLGAALTYYMRYMLCLYFGKPPSDDTDGALLKNSGALSGNNRQSGHKTNDAPERRNHGL